MYADRKGVTVVEGIIITVGGGVLLAVILAVVTATVRRILDH